MNNWKPINTLKMEHGTVLLFSEEWVDYNFNPHGIREGFRNEGDDGPIMSAEWIDDWDCYATDEGYEATHWTELPKPPNQEEK